jgi:hypothetical protein
MSHWRKQFVDDKTIGAHDLEVDGKFGTAIVKIKRFYQDTLVGSMGKEDKVFAELIGFKKPMIVNRTNFKRLETYFDSFNMDDFLNKDVLLQVEKVKSPEGIVPALRFSSRPIPKAQKQPIADADFPKALAAVQNGSTTAEKLKETRALTPKQIKQLDEI